MVYNTLGVQSNVSVMTTLLSVTIGAMGAMPYLLEMVISTGSVSHCEYVSKITHLFKFPHLG